MKTDLQRCVLCSTTSIVFVKLILSVSIDEVMVKYYGHHTAKQYIRGKPIKFGFKLWCLASSDGDLYHAEPYAGAKTQSDNFGTGVGGDVVLSLVKKCQIPEGCKLYFDNYFTSFLLLERLSEIKIYGAGTIRINKVSSCGLTPKSQFEKFERGTIESRCSENISLIQWKDSKTVIVASNCHGVEPRKLISRFCKKDSRRKFFRMPHAVAEYNRFMGGVDLFDQMVAAYRIRIRSRRWYWSLREPIRETIALTKLLIGRLEKI